MVYHIVKINENNFRIEDVMNILSRFIFCGILNLISTFFMFRPHLVQSAMSSATAAGRRSVEDVKQKMSSLLRKK